MPHWLSQMVEKLMPEIKLNWPTDLGKMQSLQLAVLMIQRQKHLDM